MDELKRLRVERRLDHGGASDKGQGAGEGGAAAETGQVYVGTWQLLKDEDEERLRQLQNDPEQACPSRRRVAIKVLAGLWPEEQQQQQRRLNKLERERMVGRKREASVLKRLARLQVPFLVEVTVFKIEDWQRAKRALLPSSMQGSATRDEDEGARGQNEERDGTSQGQNLANSIECTKSNEDGAGEVAEEGTESAIVMVMAYHEQSLFDYMEERRRKEVRAHGDGEAAQGLGHHEALVILKQMATAVAHCHRHSVCHRDIKLENFLWDASKREVRLIDFGSCGLIRPGKLFSHPCGSLSYIAPEVVQGKGYGENVDVWALGVTFYALLTGRFPFGGGSRTADNPPEVFHRIVHQRLSVPDSVPAEVADLVRRMLCRDRRHRFSSDEVLAHPALAAVSTSMADVDRIERERRRREKGKDKLTGDEEDQEDHHQLATTIGGGVAVMANNNNNHHQYDQRQGGGGGRGIKRVRPDDATATAPAW